MSSTVFMSNKLVCCLPSCFKTFCEPSHLSFSRANQVHSRKQKVMEAIQRVKGHITTNNLILVIIKIKNVWIQHVVCEIALYFRGFSGVNLNISMPISAYPVIIKHRRHTFT